MHADKNGIRKKNVVEHGGGGMYFRRLGHVRVFHNLHVPSIPVSDLAFFVYVGSLRQDQYQMCYDLLMKYGVNLFKPRKKIDFCRIFFFPSVTVESWESHYCPPR